MMPDSKFCVRYQSKCVHVFFNFPLFIYLFIYLCIQFFVEFFEFLIHGEVFCAIVFATEKLCAL